MIFRLLLLFLIVWFLFWLLKKQFSGDTPAKPDSKKPEELEDMLACSYCGTHVPESLGIRSADKFYCCQQHADLDSHETDKQ